MICRSPSKFCMINVALRFRGFANAISAVVLVIWSGIIRKSSTTRKGSAVKKRHACSSTHNFLICVNVMKGKSNSVASSWKKLSGTLTFAFRSVTITSSVFTSGFSTMVVSVTPCFFSKRMIFSLLIGGFVRGVS